MEQNPTNTLLFIYSTFSKCWLIKLREKKKKLPFRQLFLNVLIFLFIIKILKIWKFNEICI